MIDPKAIIVTDWDAKSRSNKPVLVITITEQSLDAAALPGTNNASYAEQLVKSYGNLSGKDLQDAYDDLIESFERMPHGHGYGGTTEIIEYVGSQKTRVDKIKNAMLESKS